MPVFDLPERELKTYTPEREEPADFDSFWARTLEEARSFPLDARFERVECGLRTIETYDVTYRGSVDSRSKHG
jgi:cephalosporin-C deacetylase